jgi:predicted MFS family arabinose efflux permease
VGTGTVALLSAVLLTSTAAIGAFPVLLPEMAQSLHRDDLWLGVLAGAFGLARLGANLPAGAIAGRSGGAGVTVGLVTVAAGVSAIAFGGSYWVVVAGRVLNGAGHSLAMVGAITLVLRHAEPARVAASLSAIEMAGMLGVLVGMVVAGALPASLTWNQAYALASAPLLLGLACVPRLRRCLAGARPAASGATGHPGPITTTAARPRAVPIALTSAVVLAVAWSGVGQIVVPIRGAREFGLDREQIALFLGLVQVVNVVSLMPVGTLAGRSSPVALLSAALVAVASGVALTVFGGLAALGVGCAVLGLGLAGWMLPLSLIRASTPPGRMAARAAGYRAGLDSGGVVGAFAAAALGPEPFAVACVAALLGAAAGVLRLRG